MEYYLTRRDIDEYCAALRGDERSAGTIDQQRNPCSMEGISDQQGLCSVHDQLYAGGAEWSFSV